MRKPVRTAGILFGLGAGVAVGSSLGADAAWPGVAVAVLGVGLSLVGTAGSAPTGDNLVDPDGDAWLTTSMTAAERAAAAEQRWQDQTRPTLSGLGNRVEQILRLAEKQGEDHRNAARRESEELVDTARREAETIVNRAREEAARIAGAEGG
ncbi:hypothetical protein F6X68_06730 [Micromonospora sp. AMSO12t]|uniref:DivIVA domain-containing protein n=1 Tax=unclassified Micromonospora TaxID=2617518 RepID=UPI00124AF86B|nr:hypothetical protein [Micromonospora sp. AMSO12t]KAB1160992.1 hypothetical protein F6X68_06730 [Micromonospora sp. AMSO12t]